MSKEKRDKKQRKKRSEEIVTGDQWGDIFIPYEKSDLLDYLLTYKLDTNSVTSSSDRANHGHNYDHEVIPRSCNLSNTNVLEDKDLSDIVASIVDICDNI